MSEQVAKRERRLSASGCSRQHLLAAVLLAGLGVVAFGESLGNGFVLDDKAVIAGDPRVQHGRVWESFSKEYWPEAVGNKLYRPLTTLSFVANWAISHEPWAFRLPNLLLHVGVCYLLFCLALRLIGSFWAAMAAAAVFAVHPIHTAPLNAIVDRAELSAAFFGLLAIAGWLRDRDQETCAAACRPSDHGKLEPALSGERPAPSKAASGEAPALSRRGFRWLPIGAAASFLAAILFKENAVTLAGVVVLLDLARVRRGETGASARRWRRRLIRCYLPMGLVLGGCLVARWAVLGTTGRPPGGISFADNVIAHAYDGAACPNDATRDANDATASADGAPAKTNDATVQADGVRIDAHGGPAFGDSRFLWRWGTPLAVFGQAMRLLVRPWPLSWDYSYASIEPVRRWSDVRLVWGALWLFAFAAIGHVSWRRGRQAFFAAGFVLVTYSIVSNTYIVIGTIFAERYLYLPSVGFCLLIGAFVAALAGWLRARPARRVAVAGLTGLSVLVLGVVVLGTALTIQRSRDWRDDATLNWADLLNNPRSCRLWGAAATDALNAKAYDRAIYYAEKAVEILPEYATAWRIAGLAYWQSGRPDESWADLTRSFGLGGIGHEQAAVAAADISMSRGDSLTAIEILRRCADRNPSAAVARNNLAWYMVTAGPSSSSGQAGAAESAESAEPTESAGLPEPIVPAEPTERAEAAEPPKSPASRDLSAALRYAEEAIALSPGQGDFIDTYVTVLLELDRRSEAARALQRLLPTIHSNDPYRSPLADKLEQLTRDLREEEQTQTPR